MKIEELHPTYQEIAKLIGLDATFILYRQFKGVQITFPKRLLNKTSEANEIYSEYKSGKSVREMASVHEYSERSIRRILARFKE